ncbi:MAG: amidohydrolase family protein [Clostridiales bacterium]|nr:amidohydrolase family protein [Clostridiales bacterium]
MDNLKVRIGGAEILDGIGFALDEAVSVGLVGESGSGKTMFARSLTGLLPTGSCVSGDYLIDGEAFAFDAAERAWQRVRGSEIGLILQDPFTALDPLVRCGKQILLGVPKARRTLFDLETALAEVGLSMEIGERYPHELSGGQRQRVVIAAALATEPKLLIADEATTALDVVTQREILDLIDEIRSRRSMPLLLITHDIGLICDRTDQIIILEAGRVVERGETKAVVEHPQNAYTKRLVEADRVLNESGYQTPPPENEPVILRVTELCKNFGAVRALSDVSIEMRAGECAGVVGESGSGKTTLARCVVGLERADQGEIVYTGKSFPQIVFQDPYSSLNPAHTVRKILTEALKAGGTDSGSIISRLSELLALAEVDEELLDRRPERLSGGQRQRVAIARALATDPDLLVCDESVSALDTVVQNQILATLDRLRHERGLAILFITHDLTVCRMIASRVYVMLDGKVVESGETRRIFESPRDAYTRRLLAAAGTLGGVEADPCGKLFINAKIYTVEGEGWEQRPAEAMAVSDKGRILAVGTEAEAHAAISDFTGPAAESSPPFETIDLAGRAVLPGFVDTHVHAPGSAMTELFGIYLYDMRQLGGTLEAVRDFVRRHPERSAYFGTGFYISIFDGVAEAPKRLLDEICPDKPMVLESSDGHNIWLNTQALARVAITAETPAPRGGKIRIGADGEPDGILSDAYQLITLRAAFTPVQETEAMRLYQQKMLAWGFTAAMHISPQFADPCAMKTLMEKGVWKLRVNLCAQAMPEYPAAQTVEEAKEYERLFEGTGVKVTTVKFFMDGVVEGKTAYLKEPYAGEERTGWRGEPLWSVDKLAARFAEISAAGYQLHVHTIGDAATRDVLAALRLARQQNMENLAGTSISAGSSPRDVLTHLQLVDLPEQDEMARLEVIAAFQPFWHFKEPYWYDEIEDKFLGERRALAAYPVASLLKKRVRLTFSGDYPASPVNDPFHAIDVAATRNLPTGEPFGVPDIASQDDPAWLRNAGERISVGDAIEAYTINGAFQLFRDQEIGSLAPGKYADFIVLDRDILQIDPIEIDRTNVLETWIGGERCY